MVTCPFCHASNAEGAESCFTCGKGLTALTAGFVLGGRYEILTPLGSGGMGMVYKAHDRDLDENVAVKVLRLGRAGADDLARRFRTEIKLARRVRHPNVCAIHEYGQDGHLRFIVMEHISGVDLKQVLRAQGPFAGDQGYDVALQIADGLRAIHALGILHRDLKTANIMRDDKGVIRLMDFGIAKSLADSTNDPGTAAGHIMGTPEYMSPEQARGEKLDIRSDLYSLGVVVYELFTGEVPFRGDTPMATLIKQMNESFESSPARTKRVPGELRYVLQRALAKHREERFPSASEMADVLRAARQAGPAPAPSGGPSTPSPAAGTEPTLTSSPTVPTASVAPFGRPALARAAPLILLVEDNEMNRDMLSRRLLRRGFEVMLALDGGEALARAVSDKPDLILMDMGLPGLDGWEAARRLKADPATREIPIIALTAHAMAGDRERARAAGCDDYDTKPVDLQRLLAKIDDHLRRATAS